MTRSQDNFSTDASTSTGDGDAGGLMSLKRSFLRRPTKKCPFSKKNAPVIDYKDPKLLKTFTSERGRILPARITATSRDKQRQLRLAIKRARNLALLPFVSAQ